MVVLPVKTRRNGHACGAYTGRMNRLSHAGGFPGLARVQRAGGPGRGCLVLVALAVGASSWGCAVHPGGACGPSCDDIESASQISLSSERLDVLRGIADRRFLSAHEQLYLVNAILHSGVGGEHADALITLIRNPNFAPETGDAIRERLWMITYSSERRRVADALSEADRETPMRRGTAPPSADR